MGVVRLRDVHKMQRWKNFAINKTWDDLDKMGVFTDGQIRLGPFDDIRDAWKGEPAFIVGGSKGLEGIDLSFIKNYHSIVINHAIEENPDLFEWLIFLDQRFVQTTKMNLDDFKGKIFASNRTTYFADNVVRFRPMSHKQNPTLEIEDGLYNGFLTGLCALHLALIAGADPIYLLGCDSGGGTDQNYHYKKDYPGEIKTDKKRLKYIGANRYHEAFKPWKSRIINVDPLGEIPYYKKASIDDVPFKKLKKKKKKIAFTGDPVICHVINMPDMNSMGDISRHLYERGYGNHIYSHIDAPPPKADIYLLECFINGSQKFVNFQKPEPRSKVVSLIHSSGNCMPAKCSDRIVNITEAWRDAIRRRGFKSTMIYGAIDMTPFTAIPDYTLKTFGRITRNSPGKVHPETGAIVSRILDRYGDAEFHFITDRPRATRMIDHERAKYITDIKINEIARKAEALSHLTVFADAHNTFVETFSLCLLEAMAAGLACVIIGDRQPAMVEVLGNSGIIVKDIREFEAVLTDLLPNTNKKVELGHRARKRAKEFTVEKMLSSYERLFRSVLCE